MPNQKTIKSIANLSGIGLHSGLPTNLIMKPAEANTGIRFIRTDLNPPLEFKMDVNLVVDTQRGTNLGIGKNRIQTVEHVLAAAYGLGIDNLIIELDSCETPVADGSSKPFVDLILETGIVEQDAPKDYFIIKEPIWVSTERGAYLTVLPSEEFKITFTVDYHHPLLGSQYGTFTVTPETFANELASSRTFCFFYEVDGLRKQGLIKGGSLENAIVIADDKILNESLRYPDEFVRHKILDLIGDLSLFGRPIKGHFMVSKSGHTSNILLVKRMKEYAAQSTQTATDTIMNLPMEVTQIQQVLPHRYPFLLVDRILEISEKRIVGIKNVSINENFFEGHFPGHPVMPGVLIVESMAQVTGVLMLSNTGSRGKLAYLLGVDKAKFRHRVLPGDVLRMEITITKLKSKTGKAMGYAYVGEKLVAEAEMFFALVEPDSGI